MTETKKVLKASLTNKDPQAPQEEKRLILHRFTHPQEQEEARHQTCSRDLFHLVLHWREWSLHPHQPPPSRTPLPLSRHYKQPGGSKAEVNTCPAADITECIKADLQSYSAKVRTETSMSCVSLYIYRFTKMLPFISITRMTAFKYGCFQVLGSEPKAHKKPPLNLATIPSAVHLYTVLILWILILLDHSVKILFWAIWLGPSSVQKPPPLCQTDLSYLITGDAGPPATYQQATSSVSW